MPPSTVPPISKTFERLSDWYQNVYHSVTGNGRIPADEQPLRAELYSVHQLELHAKALAAIHQLSPRREPDQLIQRLNQNERILVRTYESLAKALEKNNQITPAAEWLLDSFYAIEDQIRAARRHLPRSFSQSLPQLASGPAAGLPRVYAIAMELISHADGGVDNISLGAFVAAYQTISPLTLGELWAIPIMLRLALIENLRRIATRLAANLRDRGEATEWAQRMVSVVEKNPTDLVLVLADMARANPPTTSAFVAELTRHLLGQSQHFAFAQSWLEHRLSERGLSIAQLVQMESQTQAADQVSIGNSITSLRLLGSTDWRDFVESQSTVESVLRHDPRGVYANMGFETRDRYRHVVEVIAKHARMTESDVALQAVRLAEAAFVREPEDRSAHVGYYLIDKGRAELERHVRMRPPARLLLRRLIREHPLFYYLACIGLLSTGGIGAIAWWTHAAGQPAWMTGLVAVPAFMCLVQLAIGVTNWIVTVAVTPKPPPRMDFRSAIPREHRTMVVIPSMITSRQSIQDLLDRIEVHYVGNSDDNLHFALLTDLKDATQETLPDDEMLVQQVREGIQALNEKYKETREDIFFLFHRSRRYCSVDRIWRGYERKRGKLKEFTALLRGGPRDCFSVIVGDLSVLPEIKYVITLDTDTLLPRDAARELVGAIAHPLNRPVIDSGKRRVVDGYGILQPRVAINLPTASKSIFVRMFAIDSGLDPYTRVVSDVYQDLFREGSFIGKGIFDVDAFVQTCDHFPENAILSHDLLESAYARSALVSNIELYEDYPSRYSVDAGRRHRWMRGDWQILRWLMPTVPGPIGSAVRNPISALSWWKIFDNLRRSLVPLSMLSLLILGWLLPWPHIQFWSVGIVTAVFAVPPVLAGLVQLFHKPADFKWLAHFRSFQSPFLYRAGHVLFHLAFLAYETYLSLDAIVRTLVRMGWTRRRLLEWTTSNEAERLAQTSLVGHWVKMWAAPALAFTLGFAIIYLRPENLPFALPFLAFWTASPTIAWWVSRPIQLHKPALEHDQIIFLRKLARRTWRYFEVFVTQEENWLPPDNFQEHPKSEIAPRTSPTNIGMGLLANLAAVDFGYCATGELLRRTQNTFNTLGRLEKYRGHLYNWYDTRTLRPLPPQYVSTVDSGNLAMSLLILRSGLLESIDTKIFMGRAFSGIQDTARIFLDVIVQGIESEEPGKNSLQLRECQQYTERIIEHSTEGSRSLSGSSVLLNRIKELAGQLTRLDCGTSELHWWQSTLVNTLNAFGEEIRQFTPWALLPQPPESIWGPEDGRPAALAELHDAYTQLERIPTLRHVAMLKSTLLPKIDAAMAFASSPEVAQWLSSFRSAAVDASVAATVRIKEIEALAEQCLEHANMDFVFLYDKTRDLMSIGYNVSDHRLDTGFYDLLASEARTASYFAIANGQLDQEHWFAMRRMLTTSTGVPALLSWNGSLFEYLMPILVMPTYENTLLDRTYRAVVQRQITFGKQRGIPWGVSESGYNSLDVHLNYQYRGFGVPGLGLKRGLVDDSVVAPYACSLALMVAPEEACANLERLAREGRLGAYGMYEAIDYTPTRIPRGVDGVEIRSFMAHHQGMSLLAYAYILLGRPMQRRFAADPSLRANELLLQERVPRLTAPIYPHAVEASTSLAATAGLEDSIRVFTDPNTSTPEVQLLSNGSYHVMVSSAGGGYSRWRDFAVTRWHEDATRDCWGSYCYVRDIDTGKYWSVAYQPTLKMTRPYEAIFALGKAEYRRQDEQIETHTEISVSPEDDIELRRVTLTNRSDRVRTIELTSYSEVVLAPIGQDAAHPAFSNLFVQTELVPSQLTILCTRRPRAADEKPPWMVHLMSARGSSAGLVSFETDRLKFIGRGRDLQSPAAMDQRSKLSDSHGSVLDPIAAIRKTVRLQPGETLRVDIVTGVGESREAAMALSEKYLDPRLADRVFELAWTHSQVELRHLNASEADAQTYARLAGSAIYTTASQRPSSSMLLRNKKAQSGLWGHGISGDLPIMLVRIRDIEKLNLVREAMQAHVYWRMKGLAADLIIWNEDDSVYRQELHETILGLVAASTEAAFIDKPGGVFVRRGEHIPEDDRLLLLATASIVLSDDAGSLRDQLERRPISTLRIPALKSEKLVLPQAAATPPAPPKRDLAFHNGIGGFTQDGREYITILRPGQYTPAPWVNVIANSHFGTVVSEGGSVYTWSENSHDFRLTPWSNDPVRGTLGEGIYIRDEDTGEFWSPCPQPARGKNSYVCRHGFGYTTFEYEQDGIATELILYVAVDAPVKYARLKIMNRSGRERRISVTGYWELVLGENRSKTNMHISTELDPETNALFARNLFHTEFNDRVVFVDASEIKRTFTGDRTEFLGRNGTPSKPAALGRVRLSGRVGAGMDPCAALQVPIRLDFAHEKELVFTIGSAHSEQEARKLVTASRGTANAYRALEAVWHYWSRTLGVLYVETPDSSINFLVNGWLPYQVLSCRLWARTGFYQSGGAFGFRDQLQDSMALVHAEPQLFREHLLRAGSRQFVEGDVQHWWHAHSGRGVRTRCSDDYLWLPYAVCRYVNATGDTGVLDEVLPFIEGRPVRADEEGYYDLPLPSQQSSTLYDHCVRAINNGLRFGSHGLPLMGTGDWNDGMNRVGEHGKGESVWLAFFLYDVLMQFSELAMNRGDHSFANLCHTEAGGLRHRIESSAWDGHWYLRAYFDSGEPLGSHANPECQIDSLPQSWSVLSGAGEAERAATAMNHADERLVRRNDQLIQLFTPPFDFSDLNPGYIKGYSPGVRENGGQYTHGAIWLAMAFAKMGDPKRAWELTTILNPIAHGQSAKQIDIYRVEPYVIAADVYGAPPHVGRGGWTWYTGSAGWMYRLITESLLGIRLEVDKLRFSPCLPSDWPEFKVHYRWRETFYHILVRVSESGTKVVRVLLDGVEQIDMIAPLVDDRNDHEIVVEIQ